MLTQYIGRVSLALLFVAALPGAALAETTAAEGYAKLKMLAGVWDAKAAQGGSIRVSFRTISNDSALVESYISASGKESLTVFHLDGERLLATHYCGQGNQPRLVLDRASKPGHLVFHFVDATNLGVRADSHLVQLELVFTAADKLSMIEIYDQSGKRERTTLAFQRAH